VKDLFRAVEQAQSVYYVRLRRRTRSWGIEETFQRDAGVALIGEGGEMKPGPHPRSWRPAGALAEAAGLAWRERAATVASAHSRNVIDQRVAVLRVFVGGGDQGAHDETLSGVMQQVDALTRWLPPTLTDGALAFSWVVLCDAKEDFPWPAVFLSVVFGRFSRRLRLCRYPHCASPFVAGHPWVRKCGVCDRFSRQVLQRADVRRILDRLRKQENGTKRRQQALADLRVMSYPRWRAKWDHRASQGRKPDLHRGDRDESVH
jgi:hypothetical protein